ncbi:MAG: AAA family ATPase [Gemmataceae bacterium]
MRKLLVCSQKGGVGKTTTAISLAGATALSGTRVLLLDADPLSNIASALNLPEHFQRQLLRDVGIDLPGVLVTNVVPGVDVLSPYDAGGCSDDDLDSILALLGTPALEEHYGCVVVDSPPFMGPNPGQLISACDEFLLVMRAEAMAYRTLPAFLELMQRSKNSTQHPIKMRGILLTLPEGEEVGGRWERELRGRLGTRVLPQVVPHDDAVTQASLAYQIITHANVKGVAAEAYLSVAETLELAAVNRDHVERVSTVSALQLALTQSKATRKLAALSRPTAPAATPTPAPSATVAPRPRPSGPRHTPVPLAPRPVVPSVRRPEPVAEPEFVPPSPPRVPASQLPPPRVVRAASLNSAAATPVAPPVAEPVPEPANNGFPLWMAIGCALLAVGVGIGLRFAPLSALLPITVGIVVGLLVLVVMKLSVSQDPPPSSAEPRPAAAYGPTPLASGPDAQRPSSARRLSGLKRRLKVTPRDTRAN